MPEVSLTFPRSWLEFTDPDDPERIFRCDTTWLSSRWTCVFGRGCRGIYADAPDFGCCTLGAHFADDEDREQVQARIRQLPASLWQFHAEGNELGVVTQNEEGSDQTRAYEGACILLNRPGFSGGAGCALHLLALREGLAPQAVKPEVCWQLPVRREYDERTWADGSVAEVVVITEYDRRGWGPGGHDLDWYCSGATEAHVADEPVYVTEKDTLERLMGHAAYRRLCELIAEEPGGLRHPADPQ